MRILVCGGRDYNDAKHVYETLNLFVRNGMVIIHGGASGADFHAGMWAKDRGFDVLVFRADWNKHGRAAGPIRNSQMIVEGMPDVVIAFPGGSGTANMVRQARSSGIEVHEIPPSKETP